MKFTIQTTDKKEAMRLLMSEKMASFIWELVHNGWREWKYTDEYNYKPAWDKIHNLLNEHGIDIDELIE